MNIKTILVPLDGSDESRRALALAADLAEKYGAGLVLLHVVDLNQKMSALDRVTMSGYVPAEILEDGYRLTADALRSVPADISAKTETVAGDPAETILRRAESLPADLIVLGSRGMGAVAGLVMGSVSQTVLHRALCPVVVVK